MYDTSVLMKKILVLVFLCTITTGCKRPSSATHESPIETRRIVEAKCEFIHSFLTGVTNYSEEERRNILAGLDLVRNKAVEGDPKATAKLNGLLKYILDRYPKDQPFAQYNLGVFYADIGERKKAEKWFSKAASQGLHQAAGKLKELRANGE